MERKELEKKGNEVFDFENTDSFGEDEDELDDLDGTSIDKSSKSGSKPPRPTKKAKLKGPIDVFFTPNARKVVENRKLNQTSINTICNKEMRNKVCGDIVRFFYDNAISFNAVKSKSFAVMVESIGQFGPGLKPPSFHELRVPLFNKEVDEVKNLMKSYEEEWSKYGCSIMADGWTDKRQRTLINFLVNSPKGTVFIESIDASSYSKTGGRMFDLLNAMVERRMLSKLLLIVQVIMCLQERC